MLLIDSPFHQYYLLFPLFYLFTTSAEDTAMNSPLESLIHNKGNDLSHDM